MIFPYIIVIALYKSPKAPGSSGHSDDTPYQWLREEELIFFLNACV